jgi:hypothetical protein
MKELALLALKLMINSSRTSILGGGWKTTGEFVNGMIHPEKNGHVAKSRRALLTAAPPACLCVPEATRGGLACPLIPYALLSTGLAFAAGPTPPLPWPKDGLMSGCMFKYTPSSSGLMMLGVDRQHFCTSSHCRRDCLVCLACSWSCRICQFGDGSFYLGPTFRISSFFSSRARQTSAKGEGPGARTGVL